MDQCCSERDCTTPEDFKKILVCLTSDLERANKLHTEKLCALIRWYLDQSAKKVLRRESISDLDLKNLQDILIDLSLVDISYGCTYRRLYYLTYGKYPIEEEVKNGQS